MASLRFRTTSVMAAIAALGVAAAALRHASEAWAGNLFTTTLLLLAAATLVAIDRGRDGLGWWGFAVFGLTYLLVSLAPEGRTQLATSRFLDPLYFGMHVDAQPVMVLYPTMGEADLVIDSRKFSRTATFAGQEPLIHTWPDREKLEPFRRVGHALCALLAGLIGAGVGHLIAARRRRREQGVIGRA
jgi:hypothetical protein